MRGEMDLACLEDSQRERHHAALRFEDAPVGAHPHIASTEVDRLYRGVEADVEAGGQALRDLRVAVRKQLVGPRVLLVLVELEGRQVGELEGEIELQAGEGAGGED